MADSHDNLIRMYEGALRAIDTKAQIFMAFLTISFAPILGQLSAFSVPQPVKIAAVALCVVSTLLFAVCLYPRRAKRAPQLVFDIHRRGDEVGAFVTAPGFVLDETATIATLHDIYVIKVRSVTAGILALAGYVVLAMFALALR